MRSVAETTALVTGATDGLGRMVAGELAARGATVHIHGRDRARGERALAEIGEQTGNDRLHLHLADLASLAEVAALADELDAELDQLHLLVNNAGIGSGLPESRERQESADGVELRFAVNYLAGYALTERLLELLRRSAPARIVFVASLGQAPIDFGDPMLTGIYSGGRAYSQSKLAQITYANDLARRLEGTGVTANSLHPATYMPTKMVLEEVGESVDTLELGTEATLRLAIGGELDGVSGRFYDRLQEAGAQPQASDPEAQARLRELSEQLVARAR